MGNDEPLGDRLRKAQHELDNAELAERSAWTALEVARRVRANAANRVFNLQEMMIDALRIV